MKTIIFLAFDDNMNPVRTGAIQDDGKAYRTRGAEDILKALKDAYDRGEPDGGICFSVPVSLDDPDLFEKMAGSYGNGYTGAEIIDEPLMEDPDFMVRIPPPKQQAAP